MSKASDFLALINELWDIEQINMWSPNNHCTLAYLIDQQYGQIDYKTKYGLWMSLAKMKDFNEFSWSIMQELYVACKQDERFDNDFIYKLEKYLMVVVQENYKGGV